MNAVDPLIAPEELRDLLGDPALRIVDCRFSLASPSSGEEAYRAGHLPGAVYLHLERDLSAPLPAPGAHGGRHPLPDPDTLAARLGKLGVGFQHRVVAYDDLGEMAARAWWVLRYLGYPDVRVLDGGFGAWTSHGLPVSDDVRRHPPVRVVPQLNADLLVTSRAEVEQAAAAGRLVDSRAGERYRGDIEPLDLLAGHIPGARNFSWERVKGPSGAYRPPEELRARFGDLNDAVVYCGSGVTACPNVLALTRLGRRARLYAGSWSDWISYPDRRIATGPEHPDPEER